jgi:hypothetical protein
MDPRRAVQAVLSLGLSLVGVCRPRTTLEEPHHVGAKIDIGDFLSNTASFRGEGIVLSLRVDEPIVPAQGQSLRD